MSFRSIVLRLEELPWQWPLQQGMGVPMLRSRWIVEAIDAEGGHYEAELGPCPGVHPESLDDAYALWKEQCEPLLLRESFPLHAWDWQKPWFGLLAVPACSMTSVQTAAEQLLLGWAQRQNPEEFSLPGPISLPGSALLPIRPAKDEAVNWQEFLELWQQEFRVFKCKIGRNPAAEEISFLQRLTAYAGADLQLRLDANQNLAIADSQLWRQSACSLPISYWEEPTAQHEALHPLARDESLWDAEPETLLEAGEVWILKPSRLTLSRTVSLLTRARQQNRICVLSNAFDSGLSLRCFAWIYAAFCANPQALGFGTARFLPEDSWHSRQFSAASVVIPMQAFAPLSRDH
jgi:hypothetical protein